jgi:putative endonuclease
LHSYPHRRFTAAIRRYFVYILASRSRVLYVGVTNDLVRRLWQHRTSQFAGFTTRYRVDRLVHFDETTDVRAAIAGEKQIKGWTRAKKVALIESRNPTWEDLAARWYDPQSIEKADSSLRSE